MDYPNLTPIINLNFAITGQACPQLQSKRNEPVWKLDKKKNYVQLPAYSPRLDYDSHTGECLGLGISANRQIRSDNSLQQINPGEDLPNAAFVDVEPTGSLVVFGSGEENGLIYTDFRLTTNFANGYVAYYPLEALSVIPQKSTFSLFCKVLSVNGNANSTYAHLLNREQTMQLPWQYNDFTSPSKSLAELMGRQLSQCRISVTNTNPQLLGDEYVNRNLLLFSGQGQTTIDFRLACPMVEKSVFAGPPVRTGIFEYVTSAADVYKMDNLKKFGTDPHMLFAEFDVSTSPNERQLLVRLWNGDNNDILETSITHAPNNQLLLIAKSTGINTPIAPNQRYKVALYLAQDALVCVINGDVIIDLPWDMSYIPKELNVGGEITPYTVYSPANGYLRSIKAYSGKMTTQELIELTTLP